jgi:hypothetical protein
MDSLSILVPLKVRIELNLLADFKDYTSHRCIWEFDQLRYHFLFVVLNLLEDFKDYTSHRWKDNPCIWEPSSSLSFSIFCVHFSIYVSGLCVMISNIKIQFQT